MQSPCPCLPPGRTTHRGAGGGAPSRCPWRPLSPASEFLPCTLSSDGPEKRVVVQISRFPAVSLEVVPTCACRAVSQQVGGG